MAHEFDLVIRSGSIADGSGSDLFEGDVAVRDGLIVEVGQVAGSGREEVDARGRLVTPGFVDVHTHYDGQLTWGERLAPSSNHGVTTVVTGNCGVGFAPCREADRENLIKLMEGVEDIPELVMAEGLPWDWESFPDFLDSVERRPHDIDYAVLLPHSPLRVAVMGKRALDLEPANEADRAQMRVLAREAMQAGAAGFATSRNIFHVASDGKPIPSKTAEEIELHEIAAGLTDAGRGMLQAITVTEKQRVADFELFHRVSRQSGRPLSYTLLQLETAPDLAHAVLDSIVRENAAGGDIKAQVFNRPVGVILGLEGNYHPFAGHEYFEKHLAKLPLAEKVAAMRRPEVRAALLAPSGPLDHPFRSSMTRFERMYPMGDPANYEPEASTSVAAVAAARGVSPFEVAYDMMLERDGKAKLMVASTGFAEANLDDTLEIMRRDDTVLALGDGGAHYGLICDASYTTTNLAHWTRDRRRGERLSIPQAVKMLTDEPARLYRFRDRGRIARGMKADLNIIDHDRLALHAPELVSDLPAGGRRLNQTAEGYVATFVSGVAIQREGVDTGLRPGKLVRDAGI